jgi:hypothetical protein
VLATNRLYLLEMRLMPRPNSRDPDIDPRAFLGDELARARLAAGFSSQQALALWRAKPHADGTAPATATTRHRNPAHS